jgi:organic radical activating enzyme
MEGTTNSCHRVDGDSITPENYENFHNTPSKLKQRKKMLDGQWPGEGCEYCRDLEHAGAESDRLELNLHTHLAPPELEKDPKAINLTPRMVEVYFNNLCNLGCIYCGAEYSTVWETENKKFGDTHTAFGMPIERLAESRKQYPKMLEAHWKWLEKNAHEIHSYNVLGGEPFFQPELEQNIDFFETTPAPNLEFSVFSNLKVPNKKLRRILDKLTSLKERNHIRSMHIVCSLDCWGPQQEYIRSGLNLKNWEQNFLTILREYPNISLSIRGTLINLTMQTLPDLCYKITKWKKIRNFRHSIGFGLGHPEFDAGIFPKGFFDKEFDKAINTTADEEMKSWIDGFRKRIDATPYSYEKIKKLKNRLDHLDKRRQTNWRELWPWLDKYEDDS